MTKVLLGCDGVMANGCVLATVGTSQVGKIKYTVSISSVGV